MHVQVAGVHELLSSLIMRMLPQGSSKGQLPSLSVFQGLEVARCLRFLGKAGAVPPPIVREGVLPLNELLCKECVCASSFIAAQCE